ncbi:MAG TPA: LuxR C-terminal-related transcriptional regulator, partial [Ktedonobacteraceae bacterium]|nr:LuxR C-terminal-related transcriptional regulator [Ktedonobacteraceae bacterium]
LPLAGWRARGQLGEIRTDVLRFDIGEMQTFLQHMELDLPPAALSRLTERTEGWIAGIQLAALILRGHENHEEFLYGFRGNHRLLLEYIREEILNQQRPQVRAFLLQTSILTHLSGSLCTAVTGEAASRQLLEELRQANLFVSALDETGEEYRYHPLFAEGLRHQLRQQDPLLFQELSARAQAWYEVHEMFQEACEYALQARNFERAIPLLEQQAGKLLGNGAFAILGRWLAQLPAEKIAQSPLLLVVASWTNWVLLDENDQARQGKQTTARLQQRLQEPVDEADQATQTEARVNLSAMLVLQALDEHNAALALQRAQHILQELPEEVTYLRSLALLCLHLAQGVGHFLNGDFVAAEHILIEALHHLQATNYHFLNLVALGNLMEIYEAQGELQKSVHLHQRMLRLLRSHIETPPEFFIGVCPEYVNLLLEWNRLDEAEMELKQIQTQSRSLQIAEIHRLILILEANLLQLRLYRARGRYQEAMELLLTTEEELAKLPLSLPLSDSVAQGRVRLLLSMGKDVEATLWLNSCDVHYDDICQTPPARELFARYMTLARVLIAQGRRFPRAEYLGQALVLLEHLYEVYERAGLTGRVIEILALLSLALQAQGETRAAFARLVHAVSLAETAGFVRLFIDEGEPMLRLLARLPIQKLSTLAYLQVLLDAAHPAEASQYHNRHSPAHPLLLEPLSVREQEVLGLLATGAANQEIAARLVISPNTAKRHVKHILAKLAVTNRTQAVTRAHELHLL